MRSNIAESFLLKLGEVFQQYMRVPPDASDIFYHYTTPTGLEGILRNGGLRATYRMEMSDPAEFKYARMLVFNALNKIGSRHDLPPVAQSLTTYVRKNLDNFLNDRTENSDAYCACLTVSPDHLGQWKTYAENGNGFAIGFNLHQILKVQPTRTKRGEPFVFCYPVIYNEQKQRGLVEELVETGIRDLQTFAATCSERPQDLTDLRDRITSEIFLQLFTLINFIKAPTYNSEREMRLFLDPNNGTLKEPNIQYYERDNESIPFIFINLCSPTTKRLPLAEIKIGPNGAFAEKKRFLEDLLDELGYGSNFTDRPQITKSKMPAR